MTFNTSNEIDLCFPPTADEMATAFEDEFDRLLEQSSLGASNARAIQELAGADVVEQVQSRLDRKHGEDGSAEPEGDVDDFLLSLVCWAAAPGKRDQLHNMHVRLKFWKSAPFPISFLAPERESRGTAIAMVAWLAEANVFEHVRRDIARSVLDLTFRSEGMPLGVLLLLQHSALPCSGVIDDLTCRRPRAALTDWVSWCERRGLPMVSLPPAATCPALERAATEQGDEQRDAARKTPHELWTRVEKGHPDTRLVRPHDMLDDLVIAIEQFAVRWHSNFAEVWSASIPPPARETADVTPLMGAMLGLMHEGPQTSRILVPAVHRRFQLPDVTHAGVCDSLGRLNKSGLIQPTSRGRAIRRYELTSLGRATFRQWLLGEQGPDRGGVVLGMLSTTSFTEEQQTRLVVLSRVLTIDDDQARALKKWMTAKQVTINDTCHRILVNLIGTGRP
ncbi:hypothetical protein [Lentzea sp. NPDC092896]|uniref:hypothetical protein n=1 Tax=Lentzea sp. NPDC092896 TaxID=3364127 RepID=UPI00382D2D4A